MQAAGGRGEVRAVRTTKEGHFGKQRGFSGKEGWPVSSPVGQGPRKTSRTVSLRGVGGGGVLRPSTSSVGGRFLPGAGPREPLRVALPRQWLDPQD